MPNVLFLQRLQRNDQLRSGCPAQRLSRFITNVTGKLQELIDKFMTELVASAAVQASFEKKVDRLEIQQFSTISKLRGEVNLILDGSLYYYPRTVVAFQLDDGFTKGNSTGGANIMSASPSTGCLYETFIFI